jgi:hypothetical protein
MAAVKQRPLQNSQRRDHIVVGGVRVEVAALVDADRLADARHLQLGLVLALGGLVALVGQLALFDELVPPLHVAGPLGLGLGGLVLGEDLRLIDRVDEGLLDLGELRVAEARQGLDLSLELGIETGIQDLVLATVRPPLGDLNHH